MPFITLTVLGLALAAAVVQNAGETNWNWTVCAIGLAAAFHFVTTRHIRTARLDRITSVLLAAFIGIAALQVVPLPTSLVAILSPRRVELLRGAAPLTGPFPAWTTLSVVPHQSWQYLLTIAADILAFLVLRDLTRRFRDQRRIWITVWPLLIIAAFEGGLGFVQANATDGVLRSSGTYGNSDHYAGLLELILPFAILYPYAIMNRDRQRHESPAGPALKACGVLAFGTLILIGILYSLSRMAFLSTLASLFVAGAVTLSLRNSNIAAPVKITWWRRALPVAIVGVVVLLGFIFLPSDPLIARFSDLAHTEDISADTRAQLWHDTVGLVKDYPLVGCGLGGYESAFLPYKTVAPMNTADYAHNDFLQVLAEMGALGFVVGLLLVFRVLHSAIRGMIYTGSPDERCISIACLASLTAILLHSFVDFNLYRQANALTVAWICGIAAYRLSTHHRSKAQH